MTDDVVGCVLAGGRSARFGSCKPMAAWGPATLVEAALSSVRRVTPKTIVVAKDLDAFGFLAGPGVLLLADASPTFHPASGIVAALDASPAPWLLVVACDAPVVNAALLARLCGSRAGQVVMPVWEGRAQPFPALYRRSARERLTRALAEGESLMRACAQLDQVLIGEDQVRRDDPQGLSFADADTPAELDRLRALIDQTIVTGSPTAI